MADSHEVIEILRSLIARRENGAVDVAPESELYTGGLNLDSLEVAELSATLEEQLGRDPFTEGELPRTVGQIIAYYER